MFRFRFTALTIPLFSLTIFVFIFFFLLFFKKMVLIQLSMAYSNNVFTFDEFANKYSATPNFNLVDEPNLMRILKSEIFIHTDGQL